MSERETRISISLQQWRGVDQRSQPTLVPNGFFVMSRGVFFGLGDNAERVPGKKLSGQLDEPIFNLFQHEGKVFIQTMGNLLMTDAQELLDFEILYPTADARETEGGDLRITEDGDLRILE